ncbi:MULTISPECIES: hypothetical protein [unclassified Halomonas]|uniref:hypothetical protein n=1 Tax=unclassified Halomonas TaxID=2609666 RepID=UPI002886856E|nr:MULTISPECIES: hypothetical protein [unclassified Halomonas]MDT0499701.1 hypothetical protein [Halomonas sp. PAR7]MDT0510482.1 hypothetical protein [Halomonas sp. LES1]MDT0589809.1 hypothetical protein [Halomonas sp. PAR8]
MPHIPDSLTAGTTLALTVAHTAYPPPGWSLTLLLRGPDQRDLSSTPDGTVHAFSATAADTAGWPAGAYWYSLRATDGTEVHEIESGTLTVAPDLAAVSADHDGRTHAEKVLDAIEAVIEGRASKDQDSYRINNRELRRTSVSQLLKLRDVYRQEVRRARAAKRGRNTLGRQILARFRGV